MIRYPENNKNLIFQILFRTIEKKTIFSKYLKGYFHFFQNQSISFLSFYNSSNLPFFISQKTFYGLFPKQECVSVQYLTRKLISFYVGNLQEKIHNIFLILDFNKDNSININHTKLFFTHFNLLNKNDKNPNLEKIGYEIIQNFFHEQDNMTENQFQSSIYHKNSDLFYLFYLLYIHNLFINFESYSHFEKYFDNYKVDISDITSFTSVNQKNDFDLFNQIVLPSDLLLEYFNLKLNYTFTINTHRSSIYQINIS